MKTFDVITIGGATRDVFFLTDEGVVIDSNSPKSKKRYLAFEYGSKIIPKDAEFSYGGGGANSSISFAKMGLEVATLMRIGAEGTGSLIVKDLEAAGVNCDLVHRDRANHTALSIIISVPGKDHTMFLYRGSNDYLTVEDWRAVKAKWFYLSSLTGLSTEIIPELFSYARAHNIKIAWNPGSEQINLGCEELESYLELTDILILNRTEATKLALSDRSAINANDEKALLGKLHEKTGGIVVITDSECGSFVTDGKSDYFEPAAGGEVVETTGAGDAYGSTFVAAQTLGHSVQESMDLAARNAASVIGYIGAQKGLMTYDELRGKIKVGE